MSGRVSIDSSTSSNSSSSSIDAVTSPQAFDREYCEKKQQQLQRTVSSVNVPEDDLITTIKKTFSRNTNNDTKTTNEANEFSEKNLYKDLDPDEIELKRTQTRATIISTLEGRVAKELETLNNPSQPDDIESLRSQAAESQSVYQGVDREEQGLPTKNDGTEFQEIDPELVTWDGDEDPENPRNWTNKRKWRSTLVVTMYTLLSPFASTMLSPAMPKIAQEFGVTNPTISALMVSIYLLSWALFPPLVAPLSEMYGRKIVLDVSVWFLFFFNIGCALSKNVAQMCVFRLLAGLGGVAPICIGAGVLGDLFNNEERGLSLSLYSLGPTVGPSVSALIAGYIVEYATWRWCFWVLVIFNGVIAVYGNIFLEETYPPILLKRKSHKLRKLTGNQNLHSLYEIATGETFFDILIANFKRPLTMLFTNPMVFGLGVFMAICYGCLYILIVAFPQVWRKNYGFGSGSTGLMYISMLIGYITGIPFFQISVTRFQKYLIKRNNGVYKPEFKLPLLLVSGFVLPVGLFWFGWGAEKKVQFIMPAVGATLFSFGLIAVFYCIQNYLIEMNPRFAASAIAAVSIFRCFFGFAFPLFSTQMFNNIGYGWGCTIFGFIGLATGIPFPLFLALKGEKLRLWANKRAEIAQAKRDAKLLVKLKKQQEKQLASQLAQDTKTSASSSSNSK